jgi:hypothetical protein
VPDVPDECQENVGTCGYVRHVIDSIELTFRAERAVSPLDGTELWLVLPVGDLAQRDASALRRRSGTNHTSATVT